MDHYMIRFHKEIGLIFFTGPSKYEERVSHLRGVES